MATAKKPATKKAVKTVTVKKLLTTFQKEAGKHMDIVKRIRTKVAPGTRIITASGETDK